MTEFEKLADSAKRGDAHAFSLLTDPVFSIDLSDPKEPKILGELKIPGFSAYLHPWSDGRLLGLGYMADETSDWAKITGMKLSMFNLADPSDVKEEDVSNFPGEYNIPAAM